MGTIEATMHTDKFRGPVARVITVRSNAVNQPTQMLTLKLDVLTSVELLPVSSLRLSNGREQLATARVLVRRDSGETGELQVGALQSSVPWVRVEAERLTETRPAGENLPTGFAGDWLIQARIVDAPPEYGRHDAELRFTTGLSREPAVTIPVLVQLQPPVQVSKPVLRLPADGAEETVLLTVRRDLDPAGLEVASETPGVVWTLEPAGPRHYKVHVKWDAEARRNGAVIFKVGDESVRVPVTGSP